MPIVGGIEYLPGEKSPDHRTDKTDNDICEEAMLVSRDYLGNPACNAGDHNPIDRGHE